MFGLLRQWRRKKLRARGIPAKWVDILNRRVPFFSTLPEELVGRFIDDLKVFAAEKHFIGAKGMEITDEVRVVISAVAVRLILHLDIDYFNRLTEIVVYPHTYRHKDGDGAVLGEAHLWGTVVLSWPAVLSGLNNATDGHDTATHELAHVLDVADGSFDGAPELRAREDYRPWARVLNKHFANLKERSRDERRVLRQYGAKNPAEFFAVATESFFEKPTQMKARLPELYNQLHRFYGFDPSTDGLDGTPSGQKIGRNSRCPCKSGRKYKRCCGKPS